LCWKRQKTKERETPDSFLWRTVMHGKQAEKGLKVKSTLLFIVKPRNVTHNSIFFNPKYEQKMTIV